MRVLNCNSRRKNQNYYNMTSKSTFFAFSTAAVLPARRADVEAYSAESLPGGVALGSPSLQSRFSQHSNVLFLDAAAGLIRYSGKKDDRTATSSSSGSLFGVLVFSVILPNLLVITSADMIVGNERERARVYWNTRLPPNRVKSATTDDTRSPGHVYNTRPSANRSVSPPKTVSTSTTTWQHRDTE